eukprot:g8743.t1
MAASKSKTSSSKAEHKKVQKTIAKSKLKQKETKETKKAKEKKEKKVKRVTPEKKQKEEQKCAKKAAAKEEKEEKEEKKQKVAEKVEKVKKHEKKESGKQAAKTPESVAVDAVKKEDSSKRVAEKSLECDANKRPARRVSFKSPEYVVKTPPTRTVASPSPVPSAARSVEAWMEEAAAQGMSLEDFMSDVSTKYLEAQVESRMKDLVKTSKGKGVEDDDEEGANEDASSESSSEETKSNSSEDGEGGITETEIEDSLSEGGPEDDEDDGENEDGDEDAIDEGIDALLDGSPASEAEEEEEDKNDKGERKKTGKGKGEDATEKKKAEKMSKKEKGKKDPENDKAAVIKEAVEDQERKFKDATSVTHKAEYDKFCRQCLDRKKFPVSLAPHFVKNKLDLFRGWLEVSQSWSRLEVEFDRRAERKLTSKKSRAGIKARDILKMYPKEKAEDLMKRLKSKGLFHFDDDFPNDEEEIFYYVGQGNEFKDESITTDGVAVKIKETGNKELADTLTGDDGLLRNGAVPAVQAHNEAGEKALIDAVAGSTEKAPKEPKPKRDPATKAEPKTVLDKARDEMENCAHPHPPVYRSRLLKDLIHNDARGDTVCGSCGELVEDRTMVTEATFIQTASGGKALAGRAVDFSHGIFAGPCSQEVALNKGLSRIGFLADRLQLPAKIQEAGRRMYQLACQLNFTARLQRSSFVFLLSVVDSAFSGSSLFLHTMARFGPCVFASDFFRLGFVLPSHSHSQVDLVVLVMGLSCLGFVSTLSVIESTLLDSVLSAQSLVQLDLPSLALQFAHLGSLTSPRSFACLGLVASLFGSLRLGFTVLMSDATSFGLAPLLRSFAQLGPAILVFDFTSFELPMLLRGLMLLVLGLTRAGFVFSPSVVDTANLGSAPLPRSFSHPGLAALILGFEHLESSVSLRCFACLEFSCSVLGLLRMGLPLLVLDSAPPGFSSSVQSSTCSESLPFILGFGQVEPLMPLRSHACLDLPVFLLGLSRIGLVFMLPVFEKVSFGSNLPLRSFAWSGSATLVVGFSHSNSSSSLRGFACAGPAISVLGSSCLSSSPFVLDFVTVGFLTPTRSVSRMDLAMFALQVAHVGLPLFLRGYVWLGSQLLVMGMSRVGSIFVLPVMEGTKLGFATFLHSFARLSHVGLVILVLDGCTLGLALSLHSFFRSGSAAFVVDCAHLDSSLFLRSLAQIGSALLALKLASAGFPPLLRNLARVAFMLLACGLARMGFVLLALDHILSGSVLPVKSSSWVGSVLFACDLAHVEPLPSSRSYLCLGSTSSACGASRLGSIFTLSVQECALFDFMSSVRSFSRLGFALFVTQFASPDSSTSLRQFAHMGLGTSILGQVRFELTSLVLDRTYLGFSSPLQSCAYVGSVPPAVALASFEPSTPLRSLAKPGLAVPVCSYGRLGSLLLLRSFSQVALSVLLLGLARFELISPTSDTTLTEPPLLARSLG